MVNYNKIKADIENMKIGDVDKVLVKKYGFHTIKKLKTYSEDIKRELLYDLEKEFLYSQEMMKSLYSI